MMMCHQGQIVWFQPTYLFVRKLSTEFEFQYLNKILLQQNYELRTACASGYNGIPRYI